MLLWLSFHCVLHWVYISQFTLGMVCLSAFQHCGYYIWLNRRWAIAIDDNNSRMIWRIWLLHFPLARTGRTNVYFQYKAISVDAPTFEIQQCHNIVLSHEDILPAHHVVIASVVSKCHEKLAERVISTLWQKHCLLDSQQIQSRLNVLEKVFKCFAFI